MQKLDIYYKEELAKKLDYILFKKKISNTEVARKLGYADGAIVGRWRNEKDLNSNIMVMAQEAMERYFAVPMELWDKQMEYQPEKIDILLTEYEENPPRTINNKLFKEDKKLMSKLVGEWYAYIYPSNPSSSSENEGIWIVKTTITEDYRVVDEYDNEGFLQIGKNQSLILKESYDEGDLTVIRFTNRQVAYKHFRFVIVSTQNGTENEMVNFGFYSKKKYSPNIAKEILGSIDSVQLKLDLGFNDRMIKHVVI